MHVSGRASALHSKVEHNSIFKSFLVIFIIQRAPYYCAPLCAGRFQQRGRVLVTRCVGKVWFLPREAPLAASSGKLTRSLFSLRTILSPDPPEFRFLRRPIAVCRRHQPSGVWYLRLNVLPPEVGTSLATDTQRRRSFPRIVRPFLHRVGGLPSLRLEALRKEGDIEIRHNNGEKKNTERETQKQF